MLVSLCMEYKVLLLRGYIGFTPAPSPSAREKFAGPRLEPAYSPQSPALLLPQFHFVLVLSKILPCWLTS